jgi:hypothetical protein
VSRGLGTVQRRILSLLEESPSWLCAAELCGLAGWQTEAAYRACLRAVRGLDRRGLVLTARLPLRYDDGNVTTSLACWLERHEPPRWTGRPVTPGHQHGRRRGEGCDPPAAVIAAGVESILAERGGRLDYSDVRSAVDRRLGRCSQTYLRRALELLARRGRVALTLGYKYPGSRQRCVVSVALVSAPREPNVAQGTLKQEDAADR